jgi:hypothetical protein
MLAAAGLALAGRAAARLGARLGLAVSRSTLLRMIRGLPDPPVGTVAVLGVDLSRPCGYLDRFPSSRRKPCSGWAS